ncbi:hypothetical protein OESDEN_18466 [Oesophagostomum dentatum]|uniref:Uncharacterized protein n=1 Tax=Oesophagostomum dentatum TaxID=61180 RepID=A0A0B1SF49_OESDE|nr:hypothetical protein OESDEN_18466 [Oesophagostomum dentatum]
MIIPNAARQRESKENASNTALLMTEFQQTTSTTYSALNHSMRSGTASWITCPRTPPSRKDRLSVFVYINKDNNYREPVLWERREKSRKITKKREKLVISVL